MLFPVAVLYETITSIRNQRFDSGKIKCTVFDKPIIVVGNLTVGGTGKTPHVEYLAHHFIDKKKIALVSRGYGRKTKGFVLGNSNSSANEIGDEPMQYMTKFGRKAAVAVGEKRVFAIRELLNKDNYDLFLLDDAYQHRSLKASFYVLLTDYGRLFTEDFILPLGLLREAREGASRADVIVVSKCPSSLTSTEQEGIIKDIRKYSSAQVFFTQMIQAEAVNYSNKQELERDSKVVTLSAIAQNELFIEEVARKYEVKKSFSFRDHHSFTLTELQEVLHYVKDDNISVITTEKDFMRLSQPEFMDLTSKMSIFVIPIKVEFLAKESEFLTLIEKGIVSVDKQNSKI